MHHIILYACRHEPSAKDNSMKGTVCGAGNMPMGECIIVVGGWAVGGGVSNIYFSCLYEH